MKFPKLALAEKGPDLSANEIRPVSSMPGSSQRDSALLSELRVKMKPSDEQNVR